MTQIKTADLDYAMKHQCVIQLYSDLGLFFTLSH